MPKRKGEFGARQKQKQIKKVAEMTHVSGSVERIIRWSIRMIAFLCLI